MTQRLKLSIATGDYDRVRALVDGQVQVEGCDITYLVMGPEENFFRSLTNHEFDVTELGLSNYVIALSRGINEYVAIPVFLSRIFRHSAIYIRDDAGIAKPADLIGREVGVPVYEMTAALWVRGMLQEEYGIQPSQIEWRTGGLEEPGRRSKYPMKFPDNLRIAPVPSDRALSEMLEKGEITALISARAPSCFERRSPHIVRMFPDYRSAEKDYYAKRRLFPIMHMLGLRRSLAEQHPWLPSSLFKAFLQAKQRCLSRISDQAALQVSVPWIMADIEECKALMGEDYWRYGFRENLPELERITRWSFEHGLSDRQLKPEELFHPATLEQARM